MPGDEQLPGSGVSEAGDSDTEIELKPPRRFQVLLHNDDYTTMEFVIDILRSIFHRSVEESARIMLKVHQDGMGLAGVYTAQVAETKVRTGRERAKEEGHPLLCTMEPE